MEHYTAYTKYEHVEKEKPNGDVVFVWRPLNTILEFGDYDPEQTIHNIEPTKGISLDIEAKHEPLGVPVSYGNRDFSIKERTIRYQR